MWKDFTHNMKKVRFNDIGIIHEIPDKDKINYKLINEQRLKS